MEEIGAHRHPAARACRTRPSYIRQGAFPAFLGSQAGKANQSQDTDQRALCNIGCRTDPQQAPAVLLDPPFHPPARRRQIPLQAWGLIHQQAAEQAHAAGAQQVLEPGNQGHDHRRQDVAKQQIRRMSLQQRHEGLRRPGGHRQGLGAVQAIEGGVFAGRALRQGIAVGGRYGRRPQPQGGQAQDAAAAAQIGRASCRERV